VVVFADDDALADDAARRVADALIAAVEQRGRADLATTGGSTPAGLYVRLTRAPLRDEVSWQHVHVWWGDDRYVPRDHPLSNVFAVDEILLDEIHGVPIPLDQVHPWPAARAIADDLGPDWCAGAYAAEAAAQVPRGDSGMPRFDLVLLGIGPDGHCASLFPDQSTLFERSRLVVGVPDDRFGEAVTAVVSLRPGETATAEDLRAALEPRSPDATSITRYGTSIASRNWRSQPSKR